MPAQCPNCGAHVEPSDAYCPNCGATLAAQPVGTSVLPTVQPATRQHPQDFIPLPPPVPYKRPWYRKKRFMIPITFLIVMGLVLGAGAYVINQRFANLHEISTPEPDSPAAKALVQPTPVITPTPKNSITMLLMGVDARDGEAIDIGVRPDSLSVLHIDPESQTCRVLSIPRDTRTELPGYGQSKINHALAVGGIPYEQLVVQNLLGIKIDHFALVDFAGVVGVVDALGGVDVVNERAFEIEGMQFPEGPLHLNGDEALKYSRFRYDDEGDFGRQRRQQEVIRAMLQKADGLDAARALPTMLDSIEGHFKTDLSVTSLVSMAGKYRDYCTADKVQSAGLQGSVANDFDELYGQELSFVRVEQSEIATRVRWLLGGD